jgi:3-oxoacyl-[acyl-carrier protein] reductase
VGSATRSRAVSPRRAPPWFSARATLSACDHAVATFGGLDIVVNNVGGSGARTFDAMDEADLAAVLDRNLFPALRVSRAALPHLRERGSGVIIVISSIYGRESGGAPSYNIAKGAEINLANAMARELAPEGIRVLSVAPGSTRFPGGSWDRRVQEDPFGTTAEVADVVTFLASPRAAWVIGACVPVDGGQSRAF